MEKLVERETATRTSLTAAPALAVQFFLIPLAVVGITILVYVGFRSLLTDQRSAQDYLAEVQSGGLARQWPAAFELSQLMDDPKVRGDKALAVIEDRITCSALASAVMRAATFTESPKTSPSTAIAGPKWKPTRIARRERPTGGCSEMRNCISAAASAA